MPKCCFWTCASRPQNGSFASPWRHFLFMVCSGFVCHVVSFGQGPAKWTLIGQSGTWRVPECGWEAILCFLCFLTRDLNHHFSTNGAQFTSLKIVKKVKTTNISLEVLQTKKTVNGVAARATFLRRCTLVCSAVVTFTVFHHFCYSPSGKWSSGSEKVPRICVCGSCAAHGFKIGPLKPIVF